MRHRLSHEPAKLPITTDNAGPRTARVTLLLAGGRCPAAAVRRRETRNRLEGPERRLWEAAKLIYRNSRFSSTTPVFCRKCIRTPRYGR
jgi:hypothetical protein